MCCDRQDVITRQYNRNDDLQEFVYGLHVERSNTTFRFRDSWGDGWHGGFWEIRDACGVTLAGGPEQGQVEGYGTTFVLESVASPGCEAGCLFDSDDPGCVACSPGTSDHDSDSSTRCNFCPTGRFSPAPGQSGPCTRCPAGTTGRRPGAARLEQCERCPPGRIDHVEVELREGHLAQGTQLPSNPMDWMLARCGQWTANCLLNIFPAGEGTASAMECANAVSAAYPTATGFQFQVDLGATQTDEIWGYCLAVFGDDIEFEVCQNDCGTEGNPASPGWVASGLIFHDPTTPCVPCPAGRYSSSTNSCSSCTQVLGTGVGGYAPPGFTSIGCQACSLGQTDADADLSTPCVACGPGQYRDDVGGTGNCAMCPLGSFSQPGASSVAQCTPLFESDAVWATCEPCATDMQLSGSAGHDFAAIGFLESEIVFCPATITLQVVLVGSGEGLSWVIDDRIPEGRHERQYEAIDGDRTHRYELSLSRSNRHTLDLHTTDGNDEDGWGEGWWEIRNACGGRIAGGPEHGQVRNFTFADTDRCCSCSDDPLGLLAAIFTTCDYWMQRPAVANNCDADVSDEFEAGTVYARQVCPVSCGDCSAATLGVPQQTCGLCPAGWTMNVHGTGYVDLDECAVSYGGCDPRMGLFEDDGTWNVEPCTNTAGGYHCNQCPAGLELAGATAEHPEGNVCVYPELIAGQFHVLPRTSLDITASSAVLADTGEQETFIAHLVQDMASSLQIDASEIIISNLRSAMAGRRLEGHSVGRGLQESIDITFDVVFESSNTEVLMGLLANQLADSSSALMTSTTSGALAPGQIPSFTYACPDGSTTNANSGNCEMCPVGRAGIGGECQECSPGTSQNAEATACAVCSEGAAGDDGICTQCAAGWKPISDRSQCEECSIGSAGIAGVCEVCLGGTKQNQARTACEACAIGTAGHDGTCTLCIAGKQPNINSTDCEPCNYRSISDGSVCTQCPAGKQPNEDNSACVGCEHNYAGASGTCTQCASGTEPNEDSTSCISCAAGKAGTGGACDQCSAGAQANDNSTQCETCGIESAGSSGTCSQCAAGKQPNAQRTACEPCPDRRAGAGGICLQCQAGTAANADRTSCAGCAPGRSGTNGECAHCIAGKQPNINSTDCEPCNYRSISDGSVCTQCPAGKQPNEDNSACVGCEHNYAGASGTCTQCASGTEPNEDSTSCISCAAGKAGTGGACDQCSAGAQANDNSTQCETCGIESAGSSGTCSQCAAGKQPNAQRTACEPCPDRRAGAGGICLQCQAGKEPAPDKASCIACPAGKASGVDEQGDFECMVCPGKQQPKQDRSTCVCRPGTYDVDAIGLTKCHSGARSAWVAAPDELSYLENDEQRCVDCPVCMECGRDTPTLLQGWTFHGRSGHAYMCPLSVSCPETTLNASTHTAQANCGAGYDGPVCGNCAEGYNHLKVGKPCDSCDEGVVNVPLALTFLLSATSLGILVVSGAAQLLKDAGLVTDLRIMVRSLVASTSRVCLILIPVLSALTRPICCTMIPNRGTMHLICTYPVSVYCCTICFASATTPGIYNTAHLAYCTLTLDYLLERAGRVYANPVARKQRPGHHVPRATSTSNGLVSSAVGRPSRHDSHGLL
eukprot:COSAG02_NODE_367_length_23739_cov_16.775127_12_plen_1608_part_00